MKKAVVIGLLALGALFVYKKTPVGSYLCSWWNRNAPTVSVPRDYEIDRARNEIQNSPPRSAACLARWRRRRFNSRS